MNSTLENIYYEYGEETEKNPDWIIEVFKKNNLYFNNLRSFKDVEELRLYMDVTVIYLHALYKKNWFNETFDAANKNLSLIDSEISRLNAGELKNDLYKSIWHYKGMSAYYLKDYQTSASIYKFLTDIEPKNDRFKNWLNYSNYGRKLRLINAGYIIIIALVAISFIFEKQIKNTGYRLLINVICFLGLAVIWSYDFYIKRNQRKIKKP